VGSVFDLSNASVARLLQSKVVLVTRGGIGRPVDEIALNKALFQQEGVEVIGAIINKVLPSKFELVRDFAGRGLARLGVELLGCIPEDPVLAKPNLGQICKSIRGRFLHGGERSRRQVKKVVIGAMSTARVTDFFAPGTLIISPGDREDILLAALTTVDRRTGAGVASQLPPAGHQFAHGQLQCRKQHPLDDHQDPSGGCGKNRQNSDNDRNGRLRGPPPRKDRRHTSLTLAHPAPGAKPWGLNPGAEAPENERALQGTAEGVQDVSKGNRAEPLIPQQAPMLRSIFFPPLEFRDKEACR
jgi:hypothetical protein